jgi:hypothetical protein
VISTQQLSEMQNKTARKRISTAYNWKPQVYKCKIIQNEQELKQNKFHYNKKKRWRLVAFFEAVGL